MHYLDIYETVRHGTEDFPLAYYWVDSQSPRYRMPCHWHRETELVYVLEGSFHASFNGVSYCIHKGELGYVPPGGLHEGEPENCVYECLVFYPYLVLGQTPLIRDILQKMENEKITIFSHFTKEHIGILKCASRFFAAAREKKAGWELLVAAGLLDFYGTVYQKEYYQAKEEKGVNFSGLEYIKATLEYITANYQNAVTLQQLAEASGLSAKYLCRYFRSVTHRTPIDYLNYYRIEQACRLLDEGKQTITQVAYACGFNDSSYFVRCFRKYKDTSPKQYVQARRQS